MEVNELEKDPDGSPGDEIQPENPSENTEVEQKNKRKNEDDGDHNNNNPSKKPLEELDSLEETSNDVDQQSTIIQHPPPIENPNDIEQQSVVIQRNATETPIAPAAEPTTLHNQDIAAGNQNTYESDSVIVIELINKSKEAKLIIDKATIRNLLRNSPFGDKYSGKPRPNFNKHQLVLVIDNVNDIPELLKINKLHNAEGEWPVRCRKGLRNPGLHYGVLKGIHPDIPLKRVEEELRRNDTPFRSITRISNKSGPTFCIKIEFEGDIPYEIPYAEEMKQIEKFNPPSWTLICNNCSGGGHQARECSSNPKCPICSENHPKS